MRCVLICLSLAAFAQYSSDAALKTVWDVGDYVQDGIVMHYDGIRNVGADKPHDSAATQWVDLAPGGGYAENKACVYGGNGYWSENAYVVRGNSCMETKNTPEFGNEFTLQIACDLDITSDDRTHPTIFYGEGNGKISLYMDRSWSGQQVQSNLFWSTESFSGNSDGSRPQVAWPVGKYVNAAFDAKYMYIMPGTDWSVCPKKWGMRQERPSPKPLPPLTYFIGGRHVGGTSGGRNYCSIGSYYSVRVYSRKLTNTELVHNRAIDEIRFHGSAVLPYTNVVVASSAVPGAVGAEKPGVYVVDGAHVFTAAPITVGGNAYRPIGYSLETWDETASAWGAPVLYSQLEYTYTVAEDMPKVRLTWRWRVEEGIERYDVHHYVQDGLLAHYDAIRNAGAEQPQNKSASVWLDLSSAASQATRGLSIYAGDPGAWTSNAYVFVGESYFKMDAPLALGSSFTIQIACGMDVDSFRTKREYPTLLYGFDNWLMQMDRKYDAPSGTQGTNIYWNTSSFDSGERPTMAWLDGRYINAAFSDTHMLWTHYADWSKRYTPVRKALNSVTGCKYIWGGKANLGEYYAMVGDFHSLRMYSRVLTNGELLRNRDVDDVRFFGLPPKGTNSIWVVSTHEGLSGNESGAYFLNGSYVFTAPKKAIRDEKRFVVVGSTVSTWNEGTKSWENPVFEAGATRRLLQSEATVARRLEWKWRTDSGLCLMIQ